MRPVLFLSVFMASVCAANPLDFAQVTYVTAAQNLDKTWCFDVSVLHNDQGWEHYADGWEIIDQNGEQLGFRLLAHPHDNEQPFTRRLCGIDIPLDKSKVTVRAKCNNHGFGTDSVEVDLNLKSGSDFSVKLIN